MSAQPLVPPPLPRQLVRVLSRLEAKLTQGKLLCVLETLPTATTIKFYESTLFGQRAIRVFVGYRTQDDGSRAKTWAYVLLNHNVAEPAVVFRDEVSQVDNQVASHHRSATSLLRRAGELLPPFRFLQFESNEETRHVRNMICALVLYYALATGIADSATRWAKFETSLIEALRYIENGADYQDWQAEQHDPTKISEATSQRVDMVSGNDSLPYEAQNDVSAAPMRGGVVRSIGRSIVAAPGTAFAKLKDALGHRDHLLDAIPFTAVTIERQDTFPDYFPFRLHLGTYRNANVYVYLVPDVRNYVKILAEPGDDNIVHEWIFNNLSDPELHLSQPFDFFMSKVNQDLATRGLRVRYFVYYYYMLAENQGLINGPELRISARTMLPKFISGCKDLREAGHGVDNTDSAEDTADEERATEQLEAVSVRMQPVAASKSLILKLRVDPHVLAIIAGLAFPYKRPRIRTSKSKQVSNGENEEDMQQYDLISGVEHEDAPTTHEAVVFDDSLAQAPTLQKITASIKEQDVKITEKIIARPNSRDSALGPSRKSSTAGIPGFVAASSWQKKSRIRTQSPSHLTDATSNDDSDAQDKKSAMDTQMSEAEVLRPHQQIVGGDGHTLGRQDRVLSKKRNYFYISSDDEDVMVKEQHGHAWKRASLGRSQEHPLILD